MGSKGGGKGTSGFNYRMDLHMGVCRGPVDQVREIRVGGRAAPVNYYIDEAEVDPIVAGVVPLDADLSFGSTAMFGGEQAEGGVVGVLRLLTGASDQVVPSGIKSKMGGLVADWRGAFTAFFTGIVSVNNPYPKPWSFRVVRTNAGWDDDDVWYPEKARIIMDGGAIYGMNGAHIIYECLTNRAWGRGLPREALDDESFTDAANRLCDEGFGLCMKWTRRDSLDNFVKSVINHIAGALYVDRSTGLWVLRLIRNDYNADDVPVFDYDSGLLAIDEDESASGDSAINEIIVTYYDPRAKAAGSVAAHDSAAFATQGAVRSVTQDYPGVPTAELANLLAQRDLQAQSVELRRFKLTFDRRAWNIAPAAVFRISVPSRGIENMVLRAAKIEDTTITNGRVIITAMQDVFSEPLTSYVGVVESGFVAPDGAASPIDDRALSESTYQDLKANLTAAEFGALTDESTYLVTQAAAPTSLSMGYEVWTAPGGDPLVRRELALFTPTTVLTGSLAALATSLTISPAIRSISLPTGIVARIISEAGEEIVRVVTYDETTGAMTLERGCVDTVPRAHPVGARVWFYGERAGTDSIAYLTGEEIDVALLTRTSSAVLALGLGDTDTLTFAGRRERPYPPGALTINGAAFPLASEPTYPTAPFVLAWTHRDRLAQGDQVVAHGEASVGPEVGTTYTVRILDGKGTPKQKMQELHDAAVHGEARERERHAHRRERGRQPQRDDLILQQLVH